MTTATGSTPPAVLGDLLILVPHLGELGAAIVGLAAYSVSLIYQLHVMRRRLGGSIHSFLLPRAEDARWAIGLVARRRRHV
jgi:hypothetical protein